MSASGPCDTMWSLAHEPRDSWHGIRQVVCEHGLYPLILIIYYIFDLGHEDPQKHTITSEIHKLHTKKEELHKRLHWKEKKSNSQHIMTVVQHWNMCTNYNTLLPTTKLQQNIIFALCSTIKLVTRGLQQHGGQRTSITKSRAVQHIQFYDPLSNRTMIQPNLLIDALL